MRFLDTIAALSMLPQVQTALFAGGRALGAACVLVSRGSAALPAPVRAACVAALTASVLALPLHTRLVLAPPQVAGSVARELVLGALFALPLRLVLEALKLGATALAAHAFPGLPSSSCPLTGSPAGAASHVAAVAGLSAVLAAGGDRAVVAGFAGSFTALPAGAGITASGLLSAVESLGSDYFAVAAAALLPLTAAALLADCALALAARAAELDAAEVMRPARALAMLALLAVAAPVVFGSVASSATGASVAGTPLGGVAR